MTDWFAVTDTKVSLGAGLDLEMPGPARGLGSTVADAIEKGEVDEADLDAAVGRLLGGLDRIGALTDPRFHLTPRSRRPATWRCCVGPLRRRQCCSRTTASSRSRPRPLASRCGRARSDAHHHGRRLGAGDAPPRGQRGRRAARALGPERALVYERGCEPSLSPAVVGGAVLRAPDGFRADTYAGLALEGPVTETQRLSELRMMRIGLSFEAAAGDWSMRVAGTVVPDETGIFQLALAQAGLARLLVNDEVVLDGFTNRPPAGGNDFFGQASRDLVADVHFEQGVPVDLVVEYAFSETSVAGFRVGFRTSDGDALVERAVAAAAAVDVAIVCVGTSAETETEGRDRTTLALPGRQAELVRRVAAVNSRTVVVVNAAAPVDMEWTDDVAAVLQCWFGGQEMAAGLVDVLVGTAEPGGRLPTTLPMRLEHDLARELPR